jgi:hypothetical protein
MLMGLLNTIKELSKPMMQDLIKSRTTSPDAYDLDDFDNYNQLRKLCREMEHSKKGIVNLHGTYWDDPGVTSRLGEIMEKMDEIIKQIKDVIQYVARDGMAIFSQQPPVVTDRPLSPTLPPARARGTPMDLSPSSSVRQVKHTINPPTPPPLPSDDDDYDPFAN